MEQSGFLPVYRPHVAEMLVEGDNLSTHERFVQDTIACQGVLYAFILSLTADPDWADEILQEANLALLRKEKDFKPGSNFKAWACSVAFYQVLSGRKSRQRNRLVFDERLLNTLSEEGEQHVQEQDARRQALRQCLPTLSQSQTSLLQRRYRGDSVASIAADLGRSVGTISQTLYRARQALKECILGKLAGRKAT